MTPYYRDTRYIRTTAENGFVPPEAFLFLCSKGFIQSDIGVSIFYHLYRRAINKSIDFNRADMDNLKFDTPIPER